jgi:hypothetical protein
MKQEKDQPDLGNAAWSACSRLVKIRSTIHKMVAEPRNTILAMVYLVIGSCDKASVVNKNKYPMSTSQYTTLEASIFITLMSLVTISLSLLFDETMGILWFCALLIQGVLLFRVIQRLRA